MGRDEYGQHTWESWKSFSYKIHHNAQWTQNKSGWWLCPQLYSVALCWEMFSILFSSTAIMCCHGVPCLKMWCFRENSQCSSHSLSFPHLFMNFNDVQLQVSSYSLSTLTESYILHGQQWWLLEEVEFVSRWWVIFRFMWRKQNY